MTTMYRNATAPAGLRVSAPSRTTQPPFRPYRDGGKRLMDLVLITMSAPLVLMVVGCLALIVALNGGQPFYSQQRVGRNGRHYRMWKLRSMVVDADARLEQFLASDPAARAEWDRTQKLKADPRITAFGRILRASSLDELPQLWNVFLGDMSLVGPRPMLPSQTEMYPGSAYYRMRPGLTGTWQVSVRNDSDFADRSRCDTLYDNRLSLPEDLRLLAATVRVVAKATGY